MKRVLGLDLGASSIGWAIVELDTEDKRIVDMGSRIIPLTTDDETQFTKGQAISKNATRTAMRTARKGYDRYQMRRNNLKTILKEHGMNPIETANPMELWRLRSKAAEGRIELSELGRILMHINQKRGYKSGKEDFSDSSSSKYVQTINSRFKQLLKNNLTIGQYFYSELSKDNSFRVKDLVFPRLAYISEFDTIIKTQKKYYPEILTDDLIHKIKDETIFFQRRLKSCKRLVSLCEFEKKTYTKADGSAIISGPKVTPKSSPVAQQCKIWEFVNTITVKNKQGDILFINPEQKAEIAKFLKCNLKLKVNDLYKILGISKKDGWWVDSSISKRTVGDTTYTRISDAMCGKYPELLAMNLQICEYANTETGEIRKIVSESVKTEPLFRIWHTMYSISDEAELRDVLASKFGIQDSEVLDRLCKIDFVKEGYAGKSNLAIRKILPYLIDGMVYSDACACAGYNHSNWITKEDNLKRELKQSLAPIVKGEMRQPIVEKILNQMVNVVNALLSKYGTFDEIRVELARELKQSREERENTSKMIAKNERENKALAEKVSEYGFTPTRNRILKMRLWEETKHLCIYCNQPVNATEFLSGIDVEKEHIIPRSILFDNSSSNVICACRKCNQEKGNSAAFDYMKTKGTVAFEEYTGRVNALFEEHAISKSKHDKLLMSQNAIPSDFIERQLRETQYVSRKAMEMLREICYNVYATSGSVTQMLRHTWGWDEILHDLHFDQYKEAGMTEFKEFSSNGNTQTKEVIKGWSKRLDHRHHAIDALAIACTSQSIIQYLNSMSAANNTDIKEFGSGKHTSLEKYILSQGHFTNTEVKDAAANILVSFKRGKKVATSGKRYIYSGGTRILMQNTLVPRGALSEQTVYGKIEINGQDEIVVKQAIATIDQKKAEKIVDTKIKEIVLNYLNTHKGKYTESDPILDTQGNVIRSVRIKTGLSAVVPVRHNENGEAIGFVKPGNNHHIAIYRDSDGKYQESVVTFWNAVERKKYGLPVIISDPAGCFDSIQKNLPESFISQLPDPSWKFVMSLQSNEMFILGMSEDEYNDAIRTNDTAELSRHLYRVQKISNSNYVFRHHLETSVDDKYNGVKDANLSKVLGKLINITSINSLFTYNPHKIEISNIGTIAND